MYSAQSTPLNDVLNATQARVYMMEVRPYVRPTPPLIRVGIYSIRVQHGHPTPNAQCPVLSAQCPMPNAQCPMPNVQCPMPNACPMPNS